MSSDYPTRAASMRFLHDGGDTGAMMRAHDWAGSPLGDPAAWPAALRTAVGMMIHSDFPMFVAWGPELIFLYNDAYIEVLGGKHPHALGSRFDVVWSEIWPDIHPLIERALAGKSTYNENLPLRMTRHGYDEATWFTFAYSPLHDEHGDVQGIYCTCVETTRQVLAEQYRAAENERLRTLFEQAPGFMAILRGPEHVFEMVNGSYYQLVGHRSIQGKPLRVALPEVLGQEFPDLLDQVYRTGQPYVGVAAPIRLQREPGGALEERYVDFVYQPIRDSAGMVTGIFAEGSDVTDRKRAEDELRAANRQKDQFLAMLAHELRNPLAPITTAAELLRLGRLDSEGIRNSSQVIARQAEHLTALVDDLLDVSRVNRGLITLDNERLDIDAVVSCAVEQVRSMLDAREHRFTLALSGGAAWVMGDRTRLVQVFSNMLNNAAKYTAPGGEIALQVTAGAMVEVQISDNGSGIAPDILPYIFDLFTQADRTLARSQGGLGIGLSLVKNLVTLHGGSVEACSAGPGQGTQFFVRLPRAADAAPLAPPVAAARVAGELDILVVDDNVDAAETLAMLLEMSGHRIAVAHDGAGALDRLAQMQQNPPGRPDVFILDIGLPDMSGFELASRIRALPDMESAVLIALTGYGETKDRDDARAAGFDHHLLKPVGLEALNNILVASTPPG
jgi:PAS domain S-box-containing protein